MSIFIRGVDKPASCLSCPAYNMVQHSRDCVGGTPLCLYTGKVVEYPLEDQDWCSIGTIPKKHGRLVDAAFLRGVLVQLKERVAESPEAAHAVKWAIQCLDKMPTIIEEEENGC